MARESGRDQVLGAVRRSLRRRDDDGAPATVAARLTQPRPNLIPARGRLDRRGRIELFVRMALEAAATVARLRDAAQVPAAVAEHLARENLPARIRVAPDPRVADLPWSERPLIEVTVGPSAGDDLVSLTPALAGIAETGTLALVSGPLTPTTLNLLPDSHLVLLEATQIVGAYEDLWPLLRERYGAGRMPRTLNFITGPSRSADIEQTLQMGAHGPRSLHILLIDDEASA